jgi:hypothetical protein
MMSFDYALPELCVDTNFLMLKKKKKITYCVSLFLVVMEGIVTYGMRVGSTP